MLLNADQIAKAIEQGRSQDRLGLSVVPLPNLEALRKHGGTSIDLRLGCWFKQFRQTHFAKVSLAEGKPADAHDSASSTREHFVPFGGKFVIHPGRFVLGVTLEWLRLPPTLSGYVSGKSSLGRHGLVIETAAGIHPNFSGCLTLELANVGEVPLEIWPGQSICQIFLHTIDDSGSVSRGNFSGSRKPVLKQPSCDKILDRLRDGQKS